MAEYINHRVAVFDLPGCEKTGDSCVDLGPLGKHCVPQIKCGTKRHTLRLIVSGPDEAQLRQDAQNCFNKSATQVALAGIAAAFSPVGLPSLPVLITAFVGAFLECMDGRTDIKADFNHEEEWL
jgi:hypothetical protein